MKSQKRLADPGDGLERLSTATIALLSALLTFDLLQSRIDL